MPAPLSLEWSDSNKKAPVDVRLRHFDMDDFYLLTFLNEGKSMADCARALSLTPSAITQRMRKIEEILDTHILRRGVRGTMLTGPGMKICQTACQAMPNFESLFRVMRAG